MEEEFLTTDTSDNDLTDDDLAASLGYINSLFKNQRTMQKMGQQHMTEEGMTEDDMTEKGGMKVEETPEKETEKSGGGVLAEIQEDTSEIKEALGIEDKEE